MNIWNLFSKEKKILGPKITTEIPGGIPKEPFKLKAKDFIPSKYYSDKNIFLALDSEDQPKFLTLNKNKEFSLEKALLENAVVYVQGSLSHPIVKTATKEFITNLIQEARELAATRTSHLTTVIDEVSFLVSKELIQALAITASLRANFVLTYQSQNDLLDLKNKNDRYIYNSINSLSKIKAVYGGADLDTAEWLSNLSGTIAQEITKMEKTNFSDGEGKNFISINNILSLPPRVYVFIQPHHLPNIAFTSFVPIKNMKHLNYPQNTLIIQKIKELTHKGNKKLGSPNNHMSELSSQTMNNVNISKKTQSNIEKNKYKNEIDEIFF